MPRGMTSSRAIRSNTIRWTPRRCGRRCCQASFGSPGPGAVVRRRRCCSLLLSISPTPLARQVGQPPPAGGGHLIAGTEVAGVALISDVLVNPPARGPTECHSPEMLVRLNPAPAALHLRLQELVPILGPLLLHVLAQRRTRRQIHAVVRPSTKPALLCQPYRPSRLAIKVNSKRWERDPADPRRTLPTKPLRGAILVGAIPVCGHPPASTVAGVPPIIPTRCVSAILRLDPLSQTRHRVDAHDGQREAPGDVHPDRPAGPGS